MAALTHELFVPQPPSGLDIVCVIRVSDEDVGAANAVQDTAIQMSAETTVTSMLSCGQTLQVHKCYLKARHNSYTNVILRPDATVTQMLS